MCGRFVQKTPLGDIRVLFETTNPTPNMAARYNATPTQDLAVVRYNPQTGQRALDLLRWGLVPIWAKNPSFGARCINARAEGIETKPAFRDAFRQRRCIVPADGFYEWQKRGKSAIPYAVAPRDGLFAFAGLWERWKNPEDGTILRSFTIVTTTANELCRPIHARMPVILPKPAWRTWLGETASGIDALLGLLRPYPAELTRVYPIGAAVGNVRNDGPELLEPATDFPALP